MPPQQSLLASLGFAHHSTELGDQAIYTGHGLSLTLPSLETDPAKILTHILTADRAKHRNTLRRALEEVIGPIAKI